MSAYPIHDFRDASRYPLHETVTAWRWEFLRRNGDYQKAFELHGGDDRPHPSCWNFGLRTFPDPRCSYSQVASHFHSGGAISRSHIPTLADLERWKSRPGFDAERLLRSVLWAAEERQRMGLHFAMIDLSVPLKSQFDAIEHIATARPVIERMHPEKWRGYLRLLDGNAEGLDTDGIAAILHPHESNTYPNFASRRKVQQALERAHVLCETFGIRTDGTEK